MSVCVFASTLHGLVGDGQGVGSIRVVPHIVATCDELGPDARVLAGNVTIEQRQASARVFAEERDARHGVCRQLAIEYAAPFRPWGGFRSSRSEGGDLLPE